MAIFQVLNRHLWLVPSGLCSSSVLCLFDGTMGNFLFLFLSTNSYFMSFVYWTCRFYNVWIVWNHFSEIETRLDSSFNFKIFLYNTAFLEICVTFFVHNRLHSGCRPSRVQSFFLLTNTCRSPLQDKTPPLLPATTLKITLIFFFLQYCLPHNRGIPVGTRRGATALLKEKTRLHLRIL